MTVHDESGGAGCAACGVDRAARLDPTDRETLLRYLPGTEDRP